ncbi:hypothetical protein C8R44DRAFT_790763 [Mycena epipterygia]|nr:hypothetical protein C8R44DRAFT_790763 [Mycena epipterygia]
MASRGDMATPPFDLDAPPPAPIALPPRTFDITDFISAASTGGADDGHSAMGHSAAGHYNYFADPRDSLVPQSAAGHSTVPNSTTRNSIVAPSTVGHSGMDHHSLAPLSTVGHSTARHDRDGESIFADSPFASESPLHWQDEPALAESRSNSMDSPLPPADELRRSQHLLYSSSLLPYASASPMFSSSTPSST